MVVVVVFALVPQPTTEDELVVHSRKQQARALKRAVSVASKSSLQEDRQLSEGLHLATTEKAQPEKASSQSGEAAQNAAGASQIA
jgi:hypothetical protein